MKVKCVWSCNFSSLYANMHCFCLKTSRPLHRPKFGPLCLAFNIIQQSVMDTFHHWLIRLLCKKLSGSMPGDCSLERIKKRTPFRSLGVSHMVWNQCFMSHHSHINPGHELQLYHYPCESNGWPRDIKSVLPGGGGLNKTIFLDLQWEIKFPWVRVKLARDSVRICHISHHFVRWPSYCPHYQNGQYLLRYPAWGRHGVRLANFTETLRSCQDKLVTILFFSLKKVLSPLETFTWERSDRKVGYKGGGRHAAKVTGLGLKVIKNWGLHKWVTLYPCATTAPNITIFLRSVYFWKAVWVCIY